MTWYAEGHTLKTTDDATVAIHHPSKEAAFMVADTLNEYKIAAESDVAGGWRAGQTAYYMDSDGLPASDVVKVVMLNVSLYFDATPSSPIGSHVMAHKCCRTEAALYRREIDRAEARLDIFRKALATIIEEDNGDETSTSTE